MADETVQVQITGDASSAQAAMSDASEAVSSASSQMQESLGGIGPALEDIQSKFKTMFDAVGLTAAYEGLHKLSEEIDNTALEAVQLRNVAAVLGVNTTEMQGLRAAAEEAGVGSQQLDSALEQLALRMQQARDGSAQMQQKLAAAGITLDNLRDGSFTAASAAVAVAESHATMGEKMDLVGRRGLALLPVFASLAGGEQGAIDKATELGALTEEQIEILARYHEQIAAAGERWEFFKDSILAGVAPALGDLLVRLEDLFGVMNDGSGTTESFRETMVGIESEVIKWAAAFNDLKLRTEVLFEELGTSLGNLAAVTAAAATGHFSQAKEIWNAGTADLEAIDKKYTDAILANENKMHEELLKAALKSANDVYLASVDRPPPPNTVIPAGSFDNITKESDKWAQDEIRDANSVLDAMVKTADEAAKAWEESELGKVAVSEKALQEELKDHQVSASQFLAQENALISQRLTAEEEFYRKKLALAQGDEAAQAKIQAEITKAEQQALQQRQQAENQARQAELAQWRGLTSSIESSFTSGIMGMLKGTETFGKAAEQVFSSLVESVISSLVKMAVQWAENMILQKVEGTTAATSQISANAAVAATAAMASVAAIPYYGWAMAPEVGASTESDAMSYMALASAAGGYDIPHGANPITQLHEREMVLPREQADVIRELAETPLSGAIRTPTGLDRSDVANLDLQEMVLPQAHVEAINSLAETVGGSAAKGYDVPYAVNPVMQLHEREMVLPAEQANMIREMADNRGATPLAAGIGGFSSETSERMETATREFLESRSAPGAQATASAPQDREAAGDTAVSNTFGGDTTSESDGDDRTEITSRAGDVFNSSELTGISSTFSDVAGGDRSFSELLGGSSSERMEIRTRLGDVRGGNTSNTALTSSSASSETRDGGEHSETFGGETFGDVIGGDVTSNSAGGISGARFGDVSESNVSSSASSDESRAGDTFSSLIGGDLSSVSSATQAGDVLAESRAGDITGISSELSNRFGDIVGGSSSSAVSSSPGGDVGGTTSATREGDHTAIGGDLLSGASGDTNSAMTSVNDRGGDVFSAASESREEGDRTEVANVLGDTFGGATGGISTSFDGRVVTSTGSPGDTYTGSVRTESLSNTLSSVLGGDTFGGSKSEVSSSNSESREENRSERFGEVTGSSSTVSTVGGQSADGDIVSTATRLGDVTGDVSTESSNVFGGAPGADISNVTTRFGDLLGGATTGSTHETSATSSTVGGDTEVSNALAGDVFAGGVSTRHGDSLTATTTGDVVGATFAPSSTAVVVGETSRSESHSDTAANTEVSSRAGDVFGGATGSETHEGDNLGDVISASSRYGDLVSNLTTNSSVGGDRHTDTSQAALSGDVASAVYSSILGDSRAGDISAISHGDSFTRSTGTDTFSSSLGDTYQSLFSHVHGGETTHGDVSTTTLGDVFGTPVRAAAQGFDVPYAVNPLTQLHAREMVLPQPHADVIRGLADNRGSSAKAGNTFGDTNITQHFHQFTDKADAMSELKKAYRNFHPSISGLRRG